MRGRTRQAAGARPGVQRCRCKRGQRSEAHLLRRPLPRSHVPRVRVPGIKWEATSRRVLTMEWIDGVKLTDEKGGWDACNARRCTGCACAAAACAAAPSAAPSHPARPRCPCAPCRPQGPPNTCRPAAMTALGLDTVDFVTVGIECTLRQLLEAGFFHAGGGAGQPMCSGPLIWAAGPASRCSAPAAAPTPFQRPPTPHPWHLLPCPLCPPRPAPRQPAGHHLWRPRLPRLWHDVGRAAQRCVRVMGAARRGPARRCTLLHTADVYSTVRCRECGCRALP